MKQQHLLLGLLCIFLSCTATKTIQQKAIVKDLIVLQIEQFEQLSNRRFCGVNYKISASITNNSKAPITILLPFQEVMGSCMDSFYPEYFSAIVDKEVSPQYIDQVLQVSDNHTKKEKHIQTIDPSTSISFVFYNYQRSTFVDSSIIDKRFKGETTIQLKYKIGDIEVNKYKTAKGQHRGMLTEETIASLTAIDITSNKFSITVE